MCGRYSIAITADMLHNQFGIKIDLPPAGLSRNYNVAPTQPGLVLTDQQAHQFSLFRWGLVPFWADDLKIGSRMINARSETIADKASFREPIRKRRCLVIADSFYEWQRQGKQKTPYRILPADGSLLIMAGIWSSWSPKGAPGASPIPTFSIITGEPNAEMRGLHNRMPMLLQQPEEQGQWLSSTTPLTEVLNLLQTPADGTLKAYQIGASVGNVRNNGPELHQPATAK